MKKKSQINTNKAKAFLVSLIMLTTVLSAISFSPFATAQDEPLFSITLMAPTTNPVRRQHAALIGNAMQSVGIDAKVVYVTWSDLIPRFWPEKEDIGKTFEEGGYDIGFIGFGYTAPVPDVKSNYYGTEEAFPPGGNNYALYNSSEANDLLFRIYSTSDTTIQQELFKELSRLLFKDKPYCVIYYATDVHARDPDIKILGDSNVFSTMSNAITDIQLISGIETLVFAEAGDWTSLAPWQNSDSNSFYSLFVWGPTGGGGGLQLIDPRTDTFYLNEAKSITSNEDGTKWTVEIHEGIKFHSGVEVTADDYLFTRWAILQPAIASVGLADDMDRLGNQVSFTWLNGSTTVADNSGGGEVRAGSWKAIDKYTFEFEVPSPPYPFLNLTTTTMGPFPKHYLEQFPTNEWNQLPFATGLSGAYTFTWDTAEYGGSGSYTAYGPFGAGPYVYMGYDPVKRLASLVKFQDYWNKEALEAEGMYSVEEYYVAVIVEKDAAIAAFRTGEVNALDVNYQLATDREVLRDIGANVILKPQIGWQFFGFNMMHPVVGTGVDTPLGRSDPSRAAEAARHVRQAISYLVPRELIVQQLLDGAGRPGISTLHAFGPAYSDQSLTHDPYDTMLARAELAAAGYETGVSPITPEQPAQEFAENVLFGTSVPFRGKFVDPITDKPVEGMIGYVQESTDEKSWTDLGAVVTDADGKFDVLVTPSVIGDVYLRTYFTGITAPLESFNPVGLVTGLDKLYYDDAIANGTLPIVMAPQTSGAIKITTKEMSDILTDALEDTAKKEDTTAISSEIAALSAEVSDLKSTISSQSSLTYGAIIIAILAIIVAAFIYMRKS